jgi:outer membrane protein OmpA-like peptidoglycan-associated protein/opacity protein-like surface antigen
MLARWLLRGILLSSCLLCASLTLMAQEKGQIGIFGGGSWLYGSNFRTSYPVPNTLTPYTFVPGAVFGVRVREMLTTHFGLEQSVTVLGNNNMAFGPTFVGTRTNQFYFNANWYGYERDARVRPYFSAGAGVNMFRPTSDAQNQNGATIGPYLVESDKFAMNFGGGVQGKVTQRVALDLSVRAFLEKSPTFNFPNPSEASWLWNPQVQLGLMFMLGNIAPPVVHTFNVGPSIEASKTALCPGETSTLKISATDSIPANKITYKWTVKGQEVSTGPEYTFTAPGQAGPYDVAVHVFYDTAGLPKNDLKAIKKNPGSAADRTISITVKEYKAPQASISIDRAEVKRGEKVRLTGNGVGSDCSGQLSYRWSASQGTISDGQGRPNAVLDTTGINFTDSMPDRQCKKVLVTLDVTDEKGGKATATKEVSVCYQAPPPPVVEKLKIIQLSDINFAENSARVNNCAKRILANELYAQMTDSKYFAFDVILIGHIDPSEKSRVSSKPTSLDRQRALNTAAFLIGKGDTCKDIELNRIKVAWVGAEQESEFKSTLCDASTQEKKSDAVSATDAKAKNRRVEIWLVEKGASIGGHLLRAQKSPESEVQKKGCPK